MSVNYNAHHPAPGAYGTFTLGHFHTRGGFGINDGTAPGNQHVFVGCTHDGKTLSVLPFYAPEEKDATAAFVGEQGEAPTEKARLCPIAESAIERTMGLATDQWRTPQITLRIDSPFAPLPEPGRATVEALRRGLLPAVTAEVEWDNAAGSSEMTGFFALEFSRGAVGLLPRTKAALGFDVDGKIAVAATGGDGARVIVGPDLPLALSQPEPHLLFRTAGIAVRIPVGEKRKLSLALAWYWAGTVTCGLEGSYAYTDCFSSLRDVTEYALAHHGERAEWARQLDLSLAGTSLSEAQKFLIAHAIRSYYGSSQLLTVAGEPYYVVNEGEYCMMNTFDLAVDQLFFELRLNPWVVRNILDHFVERYSYVDEVRNGESGEVFPGGISFTHDMGVGNRFSPPGHSSYEAPDKPGCFSHMTQEQLCNWILCAATYDAEVKDSPWLRAREAVVRACFASLQQRDHPEPARRDGLMSFDSTRCGRGQEITTYDSLDASLGQARQNLYVAGKCWASYLGLARLFLRLGDQAAAAAAEACAARTAETLVGKFDQNLGFLPAVFEQGNQSAIIPAIECLVFPLEWGDHDAVAVGGRFGQFIRTLERHLKQILRPGLCLCEDGGWKLSSTSGNTWMSKIALCQHVARELFGIDQPQADAAHERWQKVGCAYWAFCDQIVDGQPVGSRYYPRGVTNILWLERDRPLITRGSA